MDTSPARSLPFEVNDVHTRRTFLESIVIDAIDAVTSEATPLWGSMTSQQMIEHLLMITEVSTGTLAVECHTPAHLIERAKRFLFDDRPTPRGFQNPVFGAEAPPLRFNSFEDARTALRIKWQRFLRLTRDEPQTMRLHPLFGPLTMEEWERVHYKHCFHHLMQFGRVEEEKKTDL